MQKLNMFNGTANIANIAIDDFVVKYTLSDDFRQPWLRILMPCLFLLCPVFRGLNVLIVLQPYKRTLMTLLRRPNGHKATIMTSTRVTPASVWNLTSKTKFDNMTKTTPTRSIFRYADAVDKVLMVSGVVFAVAQGVALPLAFYFFYSDILSSLIVYSPCFQEIRQLLQSIILARFNPNFDPEDLPPKARELFNSTRLDSLQRYKTFSHSQQDYSLFWDDVGPLAGWYALSGFVIFLLGSLHVACWTFAGQRQIERLRLQLFRSLLAKDASWFDGQKPGSLTNLLFDNVRKVEDGIGSKVPLTLSCLSISLACYIIAFVTDWLVAIVICSLVPVLFLTGFVMVVLVRKFSAKQSESYLKAGSIAQEVLANIKTVQAFNKQEFETERYRLQLVQSQRFGLYKTLVAGSAQGFMMFVIYTIVALAFWWGNSPKVAEAGGNIIIIYVCINIGTAVLSAVTPNLETFGEALSGASAIFRTIDEAPLNQINNFSKLGRSPIEPFQGLIELTDVSFSYPNRPERQVLKGFSLKIEPGQTVALIGHSGCGKSTLIQPLMRFYDPTAGSIKFDGIDLRELNIHALRKRIGLVGQEPVLFNLSIRDNVALGQPDLPVADEQIVEVCRLAQAHDFISSLPEGYRTLVGEKGAQLSGGQKQRLALARALLSNPAVLLLDEATSALDSACERSIQDALGEARQGRTTIMVAHRLSTIRQADKIVVLEDGQIVEAGNHEELLERNGRYAELISKQKMAKNDGDLIEIPLANLQEICPDNLEVDIELGKVGIPLEKLETRPKRFELLRTVLKWGKPETPQICFALLATIISSCLNAGYAIVASEFMASFCPTDSQETFTQLLEIMLVIGLGQAVDMTLQHYLFAVITERLTARIRTRSLGRMLKMDMAWLDRPENQPSALNAILTTDCVNIQGLSGVYVCSMVNIAVMILLTVSYSLYLDFRVTLPLLAILPLFIISHLFANKTALKSSSPSNDKSQAVAMETLANHRTVMALGAESYFLNHFGKFYRQTKIETIKSGVLLSPLVGMTFSALIWVGALSLGLGAWLMENKDLTFKDLIRVTILITACGTSIGRTTAILPAKEKAEASALKLRNLFRQFPTIDRLAEDGESSLANSQISRIGKLQGRIEFRNVSFAYPTRQKVQVLKNVSFLLEPGRHLAICGQSGSGKSTIVQLILRFYDVEQGQILIDGRDIRDLNLRKLRANLAVVSQEPSLFSGNIAENVTYGSRFDEEEVEKVQLEQVLEQANVKEFLVRLPEGLATFCGEGGSKLSGGQKQRIALARALCRNPKVLLLDEATSALDSTSEALVQAALDAAAQGRTTLTVAHRLSTIRNADAILVMKDGEVVEKGSHGSLMARRGVYYRLQMAQNGQAKGDAL